MQMNNLLRTVLILATGLGSGVSLHAQGVSSGIPDDSYQSLGFECSLTTGHPAVDCRVDYDLAAKKVLITWVAKDYDNAIAALQEEAVSYWPTYVSAYGDRQLLVSGKRSSRGRDRTVIELWTFGSIQQPPLAEGVPGSPRLYFQPFSVPVLSRELVYDAADTGRDLVRFTFRQHGTPSKILVLFGDSNDLYSVDTGSGSYAPILSSSSGAVEQQPALANPYRSGWSAEHLSYGYIYYMHTEFNGPDGAVPGLVLIDSNKDGVLDPGSSRTLTVDEWISQGFADDANYVQNP